MTVASTLSISYQADLAEAKQFLEAFLRKQAAAQAMDWLMAQRLKLQDDKAQRSFFFAFSAASRFFESKPLLLAEAERAYAETVRPGLMPHTWSLLQTARILLLLELPHQDAAQYTSILDRLAETADVAEQTALYAALPLLPHPEALRKRASEGVRTNMSVVFDAIALHNPYPADFLEEKAWNQMVLKAVFMARPLYQILGVETRMNLELAQMLKDFAHERWAAHRSLSPEVWRFIAPYLEAESFKDIEKVSHEGTALETEAALLACASSKLPEAGKLLSQYPEIEQRIQEGKINWTIIGQQHNMT